jgi:beta-N-acetylhexosaminidase
MTPRARVAQLLLAYPQVGTQTPVEVGGLLFVGSSLRNLQKARDKVKSSMARARVRPFVAVDMEGGSSNRMKSYPGLAELPGARELAAMGDAEVQAVGKRIGGAMKDLGFNMNLAPVLDVSGSGHMARNGRAFSGNPDAVLAKASAFARGLIEAGVVPIGKHYPGYGDAEGDSDHALVEVNLPISKVNDHASVFVRAAPFLGGVMMSNLVYPSVEKVPAILSATLVADAHRHGFLTMTDDISIGVLAQHMGGTSEQVLRKAFLAGNDLLLTTAPPDWDKGLDYIKLLEGFAAESPENKKLADDACRRVLRLKDKMGLLEGL